MTRARAAWLGLAGILTFAILGALTSATLYRELATAVTFVLFGDRGVLLIVDATRSLLDG
jgi:hypothetical protein